MKSLYSYSIVVYCSIIIMLTTIPVRSLLVAQEVVVPVKLQIALFKKVLTLSKNLQGKPVKVVVVYGGSLSKVKDEALSNFIEIGIQATSCKVTQLNEEAQGADIIYIAPGGDAAQKFCEEQGILSMTGMPSLVESGKATISVGIESGKPKVYINRTRAKIEKQEFSSDLFKVSKLF